METRNWVYTVNTVFTLELHKTFFLLQPELSRRSQALLAKQRVSDISFSSKTTYDSPGCLRDKGPGPEVFGPGDFAAGTRHTNSACHVTSPPTQAKGIQGRGFANLSDAGNASGKERSSLHLITLKRISSPTVKPCWYSPAAFNRTAHV